jgi:hypothetical protein
MEFIYTALVVLHFVGIVAIGYGFFKELRCPWESYRIKVKSDLFTPQEKKMPGISLFEFRTCGKIRVK